MTNLRSKFHSCFERKPDMEASIRLFSKRTVTRQEFLELAQRLVYNTKLWSTSHFPMQRLPRERTADETDRQMVAPLVSYPPGDRINAQYVAEIAECRGRIGFQIWVAERMPVPWTRERPQEVNETHIEVLENRFYQLSGLPLSQEWSVLSSEEDENGNLI